MLPIFNRTDADIRKHQINTLKVFNANVREIVDDREYQVTFDSGENELCLQVTLGKDFPKEKPTLTINPLILHPWVNTDGEITSAPGLLNFTVHSDLGRVVQAIIREFQRTPPVISSNSVKTSSALSNRDVERSTSNYNTFPILNSFSSPTQMSVLNSQSIFPELNKLSLNELQFLSENDDRQQEFLEKLHYIKEQNNVMDEQIGQIEELAELNLRKQEQLENLRKEIDLRIEEVTKLAFENERLHVVYQNLSDKYSPRNIQEQLRLSAEKADLECEKIAEAFLNGDMDVDGFVNQFIKSRTLCQTRKTKEEKLSHQLDSLERAGF